jgi:xylulose-5-phosphate/fructose-6-phosphate phosphoketolase
MKTKTPDTTSRTLPPGLLQKMDAYWRAANYLSVGQIYLYDNPLLKTPLKLEHIKPRLLGHWGTTPGLNFLYVHLNRLIQAHDLNMIFIAGPGHGGPALVANTYLEGSYSEQYPAISQDEAGMKRLFTQFSFPGGIPSHVAPETPGSIHEGGELGYSLAHACGAVFDNPDLIAACVVGDGEAETGALATSWHSNKFLNPARDGAVLPILHLNGYKIANPTVLARISRQELEEFFRGCGYKPHFVEGDIPAKMHVAMASTLDIILAEIQSIQHAARAKKSAKRPAWPMLVFISPKGWTGPRTVDGLQTEGTWRSHQVPLAQLAKKPGHIRLLEQWMRSYKPAELFDATGKLKPELAALAPKGDRRMGANPHANGGLLLQDLRMPDFHEYAVAIPSPGSVRAEATRVMGTFLRDVLKLNANRKNFRIFGPDETASNRLSSVFEVTARAFEGEILKTDEHLAPDGRVLEVLSEHLCQGWLEGYLLTGRHGLFPCYEAFIHIIDSMFNQHAKWLKVTRHIAELPAHVPRLAPGPQWFQPPGPRLHRPCRQQKGRYHPRLSATRRQHVVVGDRSLPAEPALHQRDCGGQTAGVAVAGHGCRGEALHCGHRHLALGEQRPGLRTRCRDGLRRGCPHAGNAGGGADAAGIVPRTEGARH